MEVNMTRKEFLEKYKAEFKTDRIDGKTVTTEDVNIFNAILKNLNRLFADEILDYNIFSSNINTFNSKYFYKCYDKFHAFDESTGFVRRIQIDERENKLYEELLKREKDIKEGICSGKYKNITIKNIEDKVTGTAEFTFDNSRAHDSEIRKVNAYNSIKKEYEKIKEKNSQGKILLFDEISDIEAELYLLLRRVIPVTRGITKKLEKYMWEVIPEADRDKIIECVKKLTDNGERSITEDVCSVISNKLKNPDEYRCLVAKKRVGQFLDNYERWLDTLKEYKENNPNSDNEIGKLAAVIAELKKKILDLSDSISDFEKIYYEKENTMFSELEDSQDKRFEDSIMSQVEKAMNEDEKSKK